MASKLLSQYGFNANNVKVLLGGWSAWKDKSYPIEPASGGAAPAGGNSATAPVVITVNPAP